MACLLPNQSRERPKPGKVVDRFLVARASRLTLVTFGAPEVGETAAIVGCLAAIVGETSAIVGETSAIVGRLAAIVGETSAIVG